MKPYFLTPNKKEGNTEGRNRIMSKGNDAYIAGFLDGDGCIMAQLIRKHDYRFGFQIRTSIVFYQKQSKEDFMQWLKNKLHYGYIRKRKDGMIEYTIVGFSEVEAMLKRLYPHLVLKKNLAKMVLKIVKMPKKPDIKTFLKYCYLVDQSAIFNYSKKRKIRTQDVKEFLTHSASLNAST